LQEDPVIAYRAKWICSPRKEPINDGVVVIAGGRIQQVGGAPTIREKNVDLGDVVLVPGLCNAHTHLEFSNLVQPIGHPGITFEEWIERVVHYQRFEVVANAKPHAITRGLEASEASGVVALGEIARQPVIDGDYAHSRCRTVVFLESLGRNESRIASIVGDLKHFMELWPSPDKELSMCHLPLALSPHAPYTVHDELFEQIVNLAVQYRCPLAMHLSESEGELELLQNGTGPFVATLERLGAWYPQTYRRGRTALYYLEKLAAAPHALVIHGNYLNQSEIDFLARHRSHMTVVFCPRTHEFFGHRRYPLQEYIDAGVAVAVGTDSCASNPDLNLYCELKAIASRYPELDPMQILGLGTIAGMQGLGFGGMGSICVGDHAKLNIVSGPDVSKFGPSALFADDSVCRPLVLELPDACVAR
jgi:cytosine/adenosine deaminase-related metal-dependent hydrolase